MVKTFPELKKLSNAHTLRCQFIKFQSLTTDKVRLLLYLYQCILRMGIGIGSAGAKKGGLFIEVLSEDIAESVADVVHH